MVLQCRGHLITEGMHPQYDLFKQWAAVKRSRPSAAQLELRGRDRQLLASARLSPSRARF
jgi:hypothetical protein